MKETRSDIVARVVAENRQHDQQIADDRMLTETLGPYGKAWRWETDPKFAQWLIDQQARHDNYPWNLLPRNRTE